GLTSRSTVARPFCYFCEFEAGDGRARLAWSLGGSVEVGFWKQLRSRPVRIRLPRAGFRFSPLPMTGPCLFSRFGAGQAVAGLGG
ncbi:MAG: hypothetical protein ACRESZ_04235, partial [Methylococcales bacterium]